MASGTGTLVAPSPAQLTVAQLTASPAMRQATAQLFQSMAHAQTRQGSPTPHQQPGAAATLLTAGQATPAVKQHIAPPPADPGDTKKQRGAAEPESEVKFKGESEENVLPTPAHFYAFYRTRGMEISPKFSTMNMECPKEAYIVRANCRDKRKCNNTYATAHATRQGKTSMEKFQLRNTDLIVIANEFIALRGKLPDNFKKNLIHPALQRHINWPK